MWLSTFQSTITNNLQQYMASQPRKITINVLPTSHKRSFSNSKQVEPTVTMHYAVDLSIVNWNTLCCTF
jgi:hypothetical protein